MSITSEHRHTGKRPSASPPLSASVKNAGSFWNISSGAGLADFAFRSGVVAPLLFRSAVRRQFEAKRRPEHKRAPELEQ